MMQKLIEITHRYSLILNFNELSCVVCSKEKLIVRGSPLEVGVQSLALLE